jgi:competence CoiA-like predicted nuclease
MSDEEWNALKSNYRNMHLSMRCCSSAAIPKLSILSTRFFAHKSRTGCQASPESSEHLKAKFIIAESARAAGWQVFTEESGIDRNGNSWIADVLCLRGNAKVAFEVQLAAQGREEYHERQTRYGRSGVRCLWLAKLPLKNSATHPSPSEELPFVIINVKDSANFTVKVEDSGEAQIPLGKLCTGRCAGAIS